MDRVSVRSFRAYDLAERGLKDLARSRLDTTREVVFQPLGARFVEAREDVVRLANPLQGGRVSRPGGQLRATHSPCRTASRREALGPRAQGCRVAS